MLAILSTNLAVSKEIKKLSKPKPYERLEISGLEALKSLEPQRFPHLLFLDLKDASFFKSNQIIQEYLGNAHRELLFKGILGVATGSPFFEPEATAKVSPEKNVFDSIPECAICVAGRPEIGGAPLIYEEFAFDAGLKQAAEKLLRFNGIIYSGLDDSDRKSISKSICLEKNVSKIQSMRWIHLHLGCQSQIQGGTEVIYTSKVFGFRLAYLLALSTEESEARDYLKKIVATFFAHPEFFQEHLKEVHSYEYQNS